MKTEGKLFCGRKKPVGLGGGREGRVMREEEKKK